MYLGSQGGICNSRMTHSRCCAYLACLITLFVSPCNSFSCSTKETLSSHQEFNTSSQLQCTWIESKDKHYDDRSWTCQQFVEDKFSICRTEGSINDQILLSEQEISAIVSRHNTTDTAVSQQCIDDITRFRCLSAFPPCETFADRALVACDSACDQVRVSCSHLDEEEILSLCSPKLTGSMSSVREAETQCVELDYEGPIYYMWIIGVGVATMFSLLGAISINLQKLSLNKHGPTVPVYKQPVWVMGFTLLVVGSLVDFVSYAFAPQSLLAPISAVTLVWNMMVAPCFLKERLDRFHVIATAIIFVGSVVTVVFSNHSSPLYTLSDLMELYRRPEMTLYTLFLPGVAALHVSFVYLVDYHVACLNQPEKGISHSLVKGVPLFARVSNHSLRMLHMIGYSGTSGIIGGQSVLFAKSTVELLKSALTGNANVFQHLETYVIINGMFMCLLLQISFLNGGLAYHDALVVVPVYQAYWIVSGVLGGMVYFDEVHEMTSEQLGLFILGILITIAGVIVLAMRASSQSRNPHEDEGVLRLDPIGTVREDDDDELEDEFDESHRRRGRVGNYAVESWLGMTPRGGAADVLLDMGVELKRVNKLLGTRRGAPISSREQRKHVKSQLIEMGITQKIANKMLGGDEGGDVNTSEENNIEEAKSAGRVEVGDSAENDKSDTVALA